MPSRFRWLVSGRPNPETGPALNPEEIPEPLFKCSMHPVIRIVLFIILARQLLPPRSAGQQASGPPAKATPAPTPIPLAKVPLEAQPALASLQEIDANLSGDQSSADGIARTLWS